MREPGEASESEVVEAFAGACPKPSPQDISVWARRYPMHAVAIMRVAASLLEISILREEPIRRRRDDVVDAGWSELDAHFAGVEPPTGETLADMMRSAGTDVRRLAAALDIGRDVLSAIAAGLVHELPKPRLLRALASQLGTDAAAVAAAIMGAAAADAARSADPRPAPTGIAAKADRTPGLRPLSYKDLILGSSMSGEQKAYWLGDD